MINRSIFFKLTVLILCSITLIFTLIFGYSYFFSRKIIIKSIRKEADDLSQATVNKIGGLLSSVSKIPTTVASILETFSLNEAQLVDLLEMIIENNKEIKGICVAYAPYRYSKYARFFAPYVTRRKGNVIVKYVYYDYSYWDWYQIPKELHRAVWSEPYFGTAGGFLMTTYSVPFYDENSEFSGVVAIDLSLTWLQELVSSIKIEKTGYAFLISKNGTFVTHPYKRLIMNESIFSMAEERHDNYLQKIGNKMIEGKSGFVPVVSVVSGKKCWMKYVPLPCNGWSLGVLFPKSELMAGVTHLNVTILLLFFAGILMLLVVTTFIANSITKPLRKLAQVSEVIGKGNLNVELPEIKANDEVGKLARSFEYMRNSLKQYIKDLTETTAAKERIESELKIARDIQMGILPKIFPPFPDREEVELYAVLESAKEVGGDLYDFFFLDNDHLCFTVGDVSGKGVPASLFMAIATTLIRSRADRNFKVNEILAKVNKDLSRDNPSLMFVTIFLGILNFRTGELEFSNGGHNPPYILRHNGKVERLNTDSGIALGVMENFQFKLQKTTLDDDDTLFLYTDGVTEAVGKNEELFGEQRLSEILKNLTGQPVRKVVTAVKKEVKDFAGEMQQADDITIMALKCRIRR